MAWLRKLLGLEGIIDEIYYGCNARVNDAIKRFEKSTDNSIVQFKDVLNSALVEFKKDYTTELDLISENVNGFFDEGIVKLEKDTVYIIRVSENTSNAVCDSLRDKLAKHGINAVIVASDDVKIIKL